MFVSLYEYFKRKPQSFEGWIIHDIRYCTKHYFQFKQCPYETSNWI